MVLFFCFDEASLASSIRRTLFTVTKKRATVQKTISPANFAPTRLARAHGTFQHIVRVFRRIFPRAGKSLVRFRSHEVALTGGKTEKRSYDYHYPINSVEKT